MFKSNCIRFHEWFDSLKEHVRVLLLLIYAIFYILLLNIGVIIHSPILTIIGIVMIALAFISRVIYLM